VPVVDFKRENFIQAARPTSRESQHAEVRTELFGVVGRDTAAAQLKRLLTRKRLIAAACSTLRPLDQRQDAHRRPFSTGVRLDRETRASLDPVTARRLLASLETRSAAPPRSSWVITQGRRNSIIAEWAETNLRREGVWLSSIQNPFHNHAISRAFLDHPNRKEASNSPICPTKHELESARGPQSHAGGGAIVEQSATVLLLGPWRTWDAAVSRGQKPFTFPPRSGGFRCVGRRRYRHRHLTLASARAHRHRGAIISNHAAGIVVGKVGTATVNADELMKSFDKAQG